ncbi:MAG TPA: hypothetical protein PLD47_11400 [Aggregatilineales bacterium]|nr:hypothetical protein [Anaerolineales bacterium]HRE48323.1 hypothetical protein [Aggregatilineales bacterium]
MSQQIFLSSAYTLIGVDRFGIGNPPDLTGRAYLAAAEANVTPLVMSQACATGNFCLVVPQEGAFALLDSLRANFQEEITTIWARFDVALLRAPFTAVEALGAAGVNLLFIHSAGIGEAWLALANDDLPRAEQVLHPLVTSCYTGSTHPTDAENTVTTHIQHHASYLHPDRSARNLRRVPPAGECAPSGVGAY